MLIIGVSLSLFTVGGGCAAYKEAEKSGAADSVQAEREPQAPGPELAPQRESVRTVQLYQGTDERSLPVVALESSEQLTLEFDLMRQQGRPVSAYFQHANRTWERDLSPSQFLDSYHSDRLLDYRSSQGTEVPYVHYSYRFPNDDIRFRLSGNYILRVTEAGERDSVLFERPFFVTDEAGQLQMGAESVMVPGQQQQSLRPVARYQPPSDLQGDPFGYAACFVRNGRLPDTRCQERPLLVQQPQLEFELERDRAFAPTMADYTVDLGDLRTASGIERTDRTVSPFHVLLEPDYARFSGQDFDADLNGQIVIREAVQGRSTPELTAEYVETTFAFVPPNEQPLPGGVVVTGSFAGMDPARGTKLQWRASRGRYEGDVLLKQGRYQYFYDARDELLQKMLSAAQARLQSTYSTFVYYQDPRHATDRLLRVTSFQR